MFAPLLRETLLPPGLTHSVRTFHSGPLSYLSNSDSNISFRDLYHAYNVKDPGCCSDNVQTSREPHSTKPQYVDSRDVAPSIPMASQCCSESTASVVTTRRCPTGPFVTYARAADKSRRRWMFQLHPPIMHLRSSAKYSESADDGPTAAKSVELCLGRCTVLIPMVLCQVLVCPAQDEPTVHSHALGTVRASLFTGVTAALTQVNLASTSNSTVLHSRFALKALLNTITSKLLPSKTRTKVSRCVLPRPRCHRHGKRTARDWPFKSRFLTPSNVRSMYPDIGFIRLQFPPWFSATPRTSEILHGDVNLATAPIMLRSYPPHIPPDLAHHDVGLLRVELHLYMLPERFQR